MKKHIVFSFVLMLGILQNAFAQMVIPHAIPCMTINPSTIDTLPSGVSAYECIEVDGETVNFKTNQNYSIKAGEYIQFDPNTVITSDGSHQFHAYIQGEDMDMAWYYPNATPGTVGRYEKLEIGVQFSDTIQQKIENFVQNEAGAKLNPFNPDDVDLYAEFWVYKEIPIVGGYAWFGPKRVNGFYYEEFARNADTIHWDTLETAHNFRIRFAPPSIGLYRCKVSANVYGHGVQTVSEFTFESVPSDNKGFVNVGENKRYLEIGEEPFFPIGHNIFSPEDSIHLEDYTPHPVQPYCYLSYARRLRKFKESGGNYFRYIVSPWNTEMEFEHLGNYSNRLGGAWEFDRILDTTKALGLKMHFNMQIHYAFESPNGYSKVMWDWSAAGDSLNTPVLQLDPYVQGCFLDSDSGYCYRKELGIMRPKDFFTDTIALIHYKNRIRYMEARWGYSTEIAVTEILSEASHTGASIQLDEHCEKVEGTLNRPYDYDPGYPNDIYKWHEAIANYMNDSLHTNHLIAVNYPGKPEIDKGDYSYFIDAVDITTFNTYQQAINNMITTHNDVIHYQTIDDGYYINKPIICSEYGTGLNTYLCDQNAGFIQRIYIGPFTGLAGMPMTWDDQNDYLDVWKYYQTINDLMTGIQLDNEDWFTGEPILVTDDKIEFFHLRKGETGENTKMVGAISNRTFNFWTQSIGNPCDVDSLKPDEKYRTPINFSSYDLIGSPIEIKNLGTNKDFKIEWYNALTGDLIYINNQSSNLFGKMNLLFPDTLTGNMECPIMFFKFYPNGDAFLSPLAPNDFETALPEEFQLSEDLISIEPTPWIDSLNNSNAVISISPNPTTGLVSCQVNGELIGLKWVLINSNGEHLSANNILSSNFVIDLSVYSSGTYYLLIQDTKSALVQTIKIIKQ